MNGRATWSSSLRGRTSPPFVVVEGGSGVGKTTAAALVARALGQVRYLPEYGEYVDARLGESLPPFPPASARESDRYNSLWPAIDLRRERDRQTLEPGPGGFQIVDTSVISVLGYELAKAAAGLPHSTGLLSRIYLQLYASGRLAEPSGWVFLRASPDAVLERLWSKGGTRPFLCERSTIEYIDRLRDYFASRFLPPSTRMLVANEGRSAEECSEEIVAFVRCVEPVQDARGLRTFLRRLVEDPRCTTELRSL